MRLLYNFTNLNKRDFYTATASSSITSGEYKFTSVFAELRIPVTTTLTSPDGNKGTIHWKDHVLEVDGIKHTVEDIRKRQSRLKSPHSRRWILGENQWQSKYVARSRSWKVWAVHDDKLAPTPAVELTPYLAKTFGKAEAASLRVFVPDAESVFLVLLLVYSHKTRVTDLPQTFFISDVLNLIWVGQS